MKTDLFSSLKLIQGAAFGTALSYAASAIIAATMAAPVDAYAATPTKTELTAREREICERIGPALRQRGLLFVGIDVIGGYLTEINVTSPTGIRAVKDLGGPDAAALIWDKIEARRRG